MEHDVCCAIADGSLMKLLFVAVQHVTECQLHPCQYVANNQLMHSTALSWRMTGKTLASERMVTQHMLRSICFHRNNGSFMHWTISTQLLKRCRCRLQAAAAAAAMAAALQEPQQVLMRPVVKVSAQARCGQRTSDAATWAMGLC